MPGFIPDRHRYLYPVLGSNALGEQVASLAPDVHVYGHSHVNQRTNIDGVRFVNNAHGYPTERRLARKRLLCIYEAS